MLLRGVSSILTLSSGRCLVTIPTVVTKWSPLRLVIMLTDSPSLNFNDNLIVRIRNRPSRLVTSCVRGISVPVTVAGISLWRS